jgi:hypothetical protein
MFICGIPKARKTCTKNFYLRKLSLSPTKTRLKPSFSLAQAKPKSCFCTAAELRFHGQETKNTIVSLQQNSGQWGGEEKYSGDFVQYNMPELF